MPVALDEIRGAAGTCGTCQEHGQHAGLFGQSARSPLEAPPADELDLVVLVVSALRSAVAIDALEVGVREVVAERERKGAGRPPEADLRLEVVHAEEAQRWPGGRV